MKRSLSFFLFFILLMNVVISCNTNNISEDVKHKTNNALAFVLIAALVIFFFVMAKITNILRDAVGNCNDYEIKLQGEADKTGKNIKSFKRTYSLSRTQLAVWTTVIASTYVYEVLCNNCNSMGLNSTALILMGISTGTTAIASLMDTSEIQKGQARHQDQPSQGFFTDILSDENGISIHRFQNVIWTIIAIIIYMHEIFMNNLVQCLPDLNQTLLALTGISSATFLTLRGKENINPSGNAETNKSTTTISTGLKDAAPLPKSVAPVTITTVNIGNDGSGGGDVSTIKSADNIVPDSDVASVDPKNMEVSDENTNTDPPKG